MNEQIDRRTVRDAVLVELVLAGFPASDAEWVAGCGATAVEGREVLEQKHPEFVGLYWFGRTSHIPHHDLMESWKQMHDTRQSPNQFVKYIFLRGSGRTHTESLQEAFRTGEPRW